MMVRLVTHSLVRAKRRKVAVAAAVALGAGAATGLLILFLGVGDRVMEELRGYGSNIVVVPAADRVVPGTGWLLESDFAQVKNHFWANNVVGAAPFLAVEAEVDGAKRTVAGTWGEREVTSPRGPFKAGVATLGWKVAGAWPAGDGAVAGARLGKRAGDAVTVAGRAMKVVGVIATGGEEDDQLLVDLAVAQEIAKAPGKMRKVLVSAVTVPDTEAVKTLATKYRRAPQDFTPEEKERLVCLNTADAVALCIEQKFTGAEARPLRQATETEGAVLNRVRGAFLLLAGLAVAAAGLSVLAATTASVVERRREIGLFKALGATDGAVASMLLAEAAVLAVVGSAAGYGIGLVAARLISAEVFGRPMTGTPAVYALTLAVALVIALAGTLWPLRSALRLQPREVLHEV